MNTITEQTTKDEILSAACEIIDDSQAQVNRLRQQQRILFVAIGVMALLTLL